MSVLRTEAWGGGNVTAEQAQDVFQQLLQSVQLDTSFFPLLAFGLAAAFVLRIGWTSRAATPDPPAQAAHLRFLGRLEPNLNLGALTVGVAIYLALWLERFPLAYALLAFALYVSPKPIEWDVLLAIGKSAMPFSQNRHETFMLDIFKAARELGKKEGQPKDAMVDMIKVELPFLSPIFVFIDAHYVHFAHVAPSIEFFATDYRGGDWFIGPNLLSMKSPPLKNARWQLHRALTSQINTDREGPKSTMGASLMIGLKLLAEGSRELAKKHGTIIDYTKDVEDIMVKAHLGAIFGEKYLDNHPEIVDDMNFTAWKYSSVSNGMQKKIWQPFEAYKFMSARKRICASLQWAVDHGESPMLDIFRRGYKEGKINHDELIGTCLLYAYALAPSRTTCFGAGLLANLPHEQDKIAKELHSQLPPLLNAKGEFDADAGAKWLTGLDEAEALKRCVRETLRLYPGVPMYIPQIADRDVAVGPWFIQKGSIVACFPFLTQRDGKYHANPDSYDPSRNLEKGAPLPDGTPTYLPFSLGPRSCQGQFYGELLTRAGVAIMAYDHWFEAKSAVPPPIMLGFITPLCSGYALISKQPLLDKVQVKPQAVTAGSTQIAGSSPSLLSVPSIKNVPALGEIDTLTILFASTQGTSRAFAERLARGLRESELGELPKAIAIRVCDVADYTMTHLTREKLVIFVVSTFGYNQPPHSGTALKLFINKPDTSLPNLFYTVLALGNSVYPSFCSFGKLLDRRLTEVGAHSIMPITLCDEIEGQEEIFNLFLDQSADVLFSALSGEAPATPTVGEKEGTKGTRTPKTTKTVPKRKTDSKRVEEGQTAARFYLVELGRGHPAGNRAPGPLRSDGQMGTRDHPVLLQVIRNRALLPYASLAQTRNVVIRTPSSGALAYQPGDLLGVFPVNRADLVTSLASRLSIADLDTEFELRPKEANKDELQPPLPEKMTYWQALTSYLDVASVPKPHVMRVLRQYSTDDDEVAWLTSMGNGGPRYTDYAMEAHSLLETLYRVPSCKPDVGHLFEALPHLQPRMYSLSSSPDYTPGEAHLSVAEVMYETQMKKWRRGVCSTYLGTDKMIPSSAADPHCQLLGFVVPNPAFHLPENPATPIVMVAIGSGIAPFRGFWQHRLAQLKDSRAASKLGEAALYAGYQSTGAALYLDEMKDAEAKKALTKVEVAFSREGAKKYVTQVLQEDGYNVWTEYLNHGAVFYVCGTINFANDIRGIVTGILQEHGNMSSAQAAKWIEDAQEEGRYKEDVYGESTETFGDTRVKAKLNRARAKMRIAFNMLGAEGLRKIIESAPAA